MERGRRLGAIASLAMVGLALAAGAWYGMRRPEPLPIIQEDPAVPRSTPPASATVAGVYVHVAGAVARPGLVVVGADARVADAIAAAGGAMPFADLAAVNLAGPVADGQQVVVPSRTGAAIPPGASAVATDDGLVHLNTAGIAELEQLPGVGRVLAERIISYREANGPFTVIEDLLDVPGIGEKKLEGLRDGAVVP